MLELLYHKHNPRITTVVYKTTFSKKTFKTITWEEQVRKRYFAWALQQ